MVGSCILFGHGFVLKADGIDHPLFWALSGWALLATFLASFSRVMGLTTQYFGAGFVFMGDGIDHALLWGRICFHGWRD